MSHAAISVIDCVCMQTVQFDKKLKPGHNGILEMEVLDPKFRR